LPPRSALPREGRGAPRPAKRGPQCRLSGAKQSAITTLYYSDGLSARQIAARTGISRRAVEAQCARLAEDLIRSMPGDMGFEARFGRAWARRLEAIGEEVTVYDEEVKALEARRKIAESEGNWPLYGQLSSLILANRRAAGALRHEYSQTYAMPPPREILAAEIRRVAASLPPQEAPE